MKILYLTISYPNKNSRNLYSDLVEELYSEGHTVTVVAAEETRNLDQTKLSNEDGVEVLRVKVGNQFGVGLLEKGITTLKIKPFLKQAINKYLLDREYDLILYSTPPVTISDLVKYCKKKYHAKSYLMLKDIFPQNAVDLGMFTKKSLFFKYFRTKELNLYHYSDKIGCMSKANMDFISNQESGEFDNKLELFPNTVKILSPLVIDKKQIRSEFDLPMDKKIFVFGGNLGKPQALGFLLQAINELNNYSDAYFLIVGDGTEKMMLEDFIKNEKPSNLKFITKLPKEKYEKIMKSCDVGIILLNSKFTIPNFPSRVMAYLHEELPIIAATDGVTDIKELILTDAECGYWSRSDDIEKFNDNIKRLTEDNELRIELGKNGRKYLETNFNVKKSVEILENFILED